MEAKAQLSLAGKARVPALTEASPSSAQKEGCLRLVLVWLYEALNTQPI